MRRSSSQILADWREQLWSTYVRLESLSDAEDFYGSVSTVLPGCSRISVVNSTAQITERTSSNVRSDPREYLLLAFQRSGHGFAEQDDRCAETRPGDFVMYDTVRPYRLAFDGPFEQMVFRLPKNMLERRVPGLSNLTARKFDGTKGPGALVAGFVRLLSQHAQELGLAQSEDFELAGGELVATALQLLGRGSNTPVEATFERVIGALEKRVMHPGFELGLFAQQQRMSVCTLQRLFNAHGTTPRKWLLDRRLEKIATQLRSPAFAGRSVTEIALSAGFNDLAHFNRAFRARYLMSPGRWRTARTPQAPLP
jgi:AraC-like DNA-binding protein